MTGLCDRGCADGWTGSKCEIGKRVNQYCWLKYFKINLCSLLLFISVIYFSCLITIFNIQKPVKLNEIVHLIFFSI